MKRGKCSLRKSNAHRYYKIIAMLFVVCLLGLVSSCYHIEPVGGSCYCCKNTLGHDVLVQEIPCAGGACPPNPEPAADGLCPG